MTAVLLCVLPSEARKQRAISLSREYKSVTVNEDSTISFCYCGAARRVSLQSDLQYADEDSSRYTDRTRRIKMHLETDGCFHVTTKAVRPETYTYCFRVDGKRKPDPLNNDTAWQKMHKWNVVTAGGTFQSDLYLPPAQQGQLIRTNWYSIEEKITRRVNIYLPAGYNDSLPFREGLGVGFPVLYLIHGINGYEGSWTERGRAIQIMENLAAQGMCKPMILVIPDVNFGVHEDRPSHHTLWNNVFNYPRLCHDHDIEKALVELTYRIDSLYDVSDERLIAGFSDGARIAANVSNLRPGYFQAVGLFSPVVHKDQLPTTNDERPTTTYYVYTGKKDLLFNPNAKRFNRRLEKAQIAHDFTQTAGGHNWRNWRLYLSDFLMHFPPE